jgi:hypothetical protein
MAYRGDMEEKHPLEIEAECLRKLRARALKIKRANPELNLMAALAKAFSEMPITANKYQYARARAGLQGLRSLPLWE